VKVLTVVGARPQFIKSAPVSAALRRVASEVLLHTGQHYDPEMSGDFFRELGLAEPDHHLGVGSRSHGEQTGRMLAGIERAILDTQPDWVLVYGDTNSTLAGALAAAKLNVPVAHVEAGLRSFDRSMPEEVNRIVADHVSTLCFAPSSTAVANLAAEGLQDGVVEVGDVMVDALQTVSARLPTIPEEVRRRGLRPGEYIVATIHRSATTDDHGRLARAVELLIGLDIPVLFTVHPRTRAALEKYRLVGRLEKAGHVTLLPPVGYSALVGLVARARAVLTDSGGVQKEAYLLGIQCITLRAETEWVETLDNGWNSLVDLDVNLARAALQRSPGARPQLYGDGHAASRIADHLMQRVAGSRRIATVARP
jgi:UDP-N-acetylglucosamine 2-epimerase